jgi:hypothetical protein
MKSWVFKVIVPVAGSIFEFLQNDSDLLAVISIFAATDFVLGC